MVLSAGHLNFSTWPKLKHQDLYKNLITKMHLHIVMEITETGPRTLLSLGGLFSKMAQNLWWES